MSSTFRLQFLGPVQAEQDGEPLRGFRSRKALALLGYLVAQGQALPRERLADLFWEDQTESRGRANLSWVLNKLKTLLPECLETDRRSVQFQRADPYWLDVDAFEELEAQGKPSALAEAVELYRGEFLQGLYLEGCTEFELWVLAERERWRQRVLRALETLVAHHSRRGEYEASLHFARRLLALEPWREATHRQVMRLLARSGQRGAALAQYEACRRILAAELGVEPALETTTLYERIQAADSLRHGLPAQPTPFVGRKMELTEIAQLLDDPDCRLLTILGPGGMGKTRLALQAGEARREAFLEGVHFVPLVALSSDDFLVSAIADALQFSLSGSGNPQVQLLNYLRGKEVLLILDNFEHLLPSSPPPLGARPEPAEGNGGGAELLGEILEKAPDVKLLITSRERLNLRWERCLEIAGLDYPGETLPGAKLQAYGAVQLLQQAARHVRQDFALSEQDRPAVARICQLVEGLPLGIELAAAWAGMYTCQEIAGEIEQGIDFLATSLRDVPPRHRSIQATFEHSWRLLIPPEQDVLMALSVFRRGFQREAAQAVADATPMVLKSLVDKSLLRFLPSGRYEMHELLRQYTMEKLAALPEMQTEAHDRHCAHYAAFLERQENELVSARVAESLAAIKLDIDNVRAAWNWAATRASVPELERGLQGLSRFYALAGPYQQGETLLRMAVEHVQARIEKTGQAKRPERALLGKLLTEQARFLNQQGNYDQAVAAAQEAIEQASLAGVPHAASFLQWGHSLWHQGDYQAAQSKLESALELAQDEPSSVVRADILRGLGNIALTQSDHTNARDYYEQSLRINREIGYRQGEIGVLGNLAIFLERQSDYVAARDCFDQVLHLSREVGDRPHEGAALNNLGLVSFNLGEYTKANTYYGQSLQIYRELGNRRGEGLVLDNIGSNVYAQGDPAGSRTYHEQALRIHRELGNRRGESQALGNLGYLLSGLGDYAQARAYCEQAQQIHQELGEPQGECYALNNLGLVCACQGDYAQARTYLEQALHIGREIDEPRIVGYILSNLGHALAELGFLTEATEACQQALALWRELNQPNLATEPLAGLARIALAQDDLPQAQAHAEEILGHLKSGTPSTTDVPSASGHGLDGTEEPARIYLTCYRVLRAHRDPRAQEILSTAHGMLQEQAATIGDEKMRRSFLENVAVHREIVEEAIKAGLG